jgi:hypothetical protein
MLSSLSAITKEAVVGESVNPGAGNFTTVSVRGVDFAPKKQETLVPTPVKEGQASCQTWLDRSNQFRVVSVRLL